MMPKRTGTTRRSETVRSSRSPRELKECHESFGIYLHKGIRAIDFAGQAYVML